MKISVKNICFALGATAILASCSENSWNDRLDGFEAGEKYDTKEDASFTMSKADFKTLAENPANIALAGDENAAALKAVGKNGYFTPTIPAVEYIPAFLASTDSPYFLFANGSKVNITYNECGETDPIIAEIAGAATYTVTADDYRSAWKSNEDFIEAFAPMTSASACLPAILKDGVADATEGQYTVVSYAEAAENPIFVQLGGGETEAPLQAIYSEPFNESEGKFQIYDEEKPEELGYVWKWASAAYGMKASAFLSGQAYATESWLISPEITLGGEKANFSFDQAINKFTSLELSKEQATVLVRVSGEDWEPIDAEYDYPTNADWNFVNTGAIDLSKYCGETIQIGFRYISTNEGAGTWEVKNFVVNAQEGSVGVNPGFFGKPLKKALANTPVAVEKTAVYRYDGSAWKVAADVMAVQPSDYKAMGFNVGSLADPNVMLPLFLKNNLPYAVAGDKMSVVYNGTECSVLVFDGQNWNVNINEMVTQVAQFVKEDGKWRFEKYMNTIAFVLCTEIVLDTQYLMVAADICACPLKASYTYGYLPKADVEIVDDIIEQSDDTNAFTFASSANVNGVEYELSEGEFLIKDSTGRYLLMQGTYNSFNVTNTPVITDGKIDEGYVFTAKQNEEGAWVITNKGMQKWIQYSIKYGSWGCYATEQTEAAAPSLYIITEK